MHQVSTGGKGAPLVTLTLSKVYYEQWVQREYGAASSCHVTVPQSAQTVFMHVSQKSYPQSLQTVLLQRPQKEVLAHSKHTIRSHFEHRLFL